MSVDPAKTGVFRAVTTPQTAISLSFSPYSLLLYGNQTEPLPTRVRARGFVNA
jgi:hypothetical protein